MPLDPDVNAEFDKDFAPASMALYRREKLLNHHVTQALLRWKWMALGKFLTIFNTIVFAVFVILFSFLIVKEREKDNLSFISSKITMSAENSKSSFAATTVPYVILVFLVMQLIKEVLQIVWLRLAYFKDLTNLLELVMFGMVWTFTLPCISATDVCSTELKWTAGEQGNFADFWLALSKINIMMVGELDYTDMLVEKIVNNNTVPGTNVPYVPLPILTICLFLVFVLMVSVVLVNLLVGLAVGDIESIQRTASLRTLIDQVLLVDGIMKSYPRFILRRMHRCSLEIKPNQNSFFKRVALSGTDLTDQGFMDMLLNYKSGKSTAEEWCEYEHSRDERQEESIKKLQATVEAQGKLLKAMADRLKLRSRTDEADASLKLE
ncbi:Transient receptor putative cation channel sub A member 1 [Desmophyllum pertusum]|uniref:Transient receptor putative cation channel sub A member 1 n=1 Tax=Desmophyllum pertusum TaxID=174260 RepID=A0A9X0D4U5_9CNID|nr:Transient receptor putative cation channel sub A member 1 [Desmophyllum pertusum]